MNGKMWEHPADVDNKTWKKLESRGALNLSDRREELLECGYEGMWQTLESERTSRFRAGFLLACAVIDSL